MSDCFNHDKAEESYLEIARQMGDGMTGEFLCFAGVSFLVFENYACMSDTDFGLFSGNRFASIEKDFFFLHPPNPLQMPDCR